MRMANINIQKRLFQETKKTTLSMRVSDDMIEALDRIASYYGRKNKQELIYDVLEQYLIDELEKHPDLSPQKKTTKKA